MPSRCRNPNKPAVSDSGWLHFVESHFGGGAVTFALDPTGISLVANDLDSTLTDFWDILKLPSLFGEFQERLRMTPFSKVEFDRAKCGVYDDTKFGRAVAFFIRNRQSRQGLEKDFATLTRNRTRRKMSEQVSAWLSAIEGLPAFHTRLQQIVILNDDAVKIIKQQDGPRTLYYEDPTYLHDTRVTTSDYKHEMTYADHVDLLGVQAVRWGEVDWDRYEREGKRSRSVAEAHLLYEFQGRFILSGYHHPLYDSTAAANGWRCVEIAVDNKASGAKTKEVKIECLWLNFNEKGARVQR